jgi:hypothetical protein
VLLLSVYHTATSGGEVLASHGLTVFIWQQGSCGTRLRLAAHAQYGAAQ